MRYLAHQELDVLLRRFALGDIGHDVDQAPRLAVRVTTDGPAAPRQP
jgi:hypothetical protein